MTTDNTGGGYSSVFQSLLLNELKTRGMIPMSTGVTKLVGDPADARSAIDNASAEVARAGKQFGSRAVDRYSNEVGTSYRDIRFATILQFESFRSRAYPDAGGVSVGVGFHMDKPNARPVWEQAFGKNGISFDDVKLGKVGISKADAKLLFDYDARYYEGLVDKALNGQLIPPQSRAALFSVAYNAPKRFVENVAPHLAIWDTAKAADAILTQSFNPGSPYAEALKARRYQEAAMFLTPADAQDVMSSFDVYNKAVEVDPKTGVASIQAVGTANVQNLDPELGGRLANLFAAAPPEIRDKLGVYSGYRSVEHQTELFNAAVVKYGSVAAARKWVAPPPGVAGSKGSNHNFGLAADVAYNGASLAKAPPDVVKWLHDNAPNYGLSFPLNNENWHIEPSEVRQHKPLAPLSRLQPIPETAVATELSVTPDKSLTPLAFKSAAQDTAPVPLRNRPADPVSANQPGAARPSAPAVGLPAAKSVPALVPSPANPDVYILRPAVTGLNKSVAQIGQEANNARMNGYRSVQEMGPQTGKSNGPSVLPGTPKPLPPANPPAAKSGTTTSKTVVVRPDGTTHVVGQAAVEALPPGVRPNVPPVVTPKTATNDPQHIVTVDETRAEQRIARASMVAPVVAVGGRPVFGPLGPSDNGLSPTINLAEAAPTVPQQVTSREGSAVPAGPVYRRPANVQSVYVPPPVTFKGTSTGRTYVENQVYVGSGGRQMRANADGTFTNINTGAVSAGSSGKRYALLEEAGAYN